MKYNGYSQNCKKINLATNGNASSGCKVWEYVNWSGITASTCAAKGEPPELPFLELSRLSCQLLHPFLVDRGRSFNPGIRVQFIAYLIFLSKSGSSKGHNKRNNKLNVSSIKL
jgi:hypothetical protein